MQMQADVQKRIQESEKKLREIPHFACQQKVTVAILCKIRKLTESSSCFLYALSGFGACSTAGEQRQVCGAGQELESGTHTD